jgi:ribosomal protein S18 acetylase RimI-like enzyme
MKTTDIRSVLKLTAEERWGFRTRDLNRMIALQPGGCLVATMGGGPIGLTTTITYGNTTGWIGNVVVNEKQRGAGIGSNLVQSAVERLRRMRIKSIGLYSYPENEAMYKRLGFETIGGFATLSMRNSDVNFARRMGETPFHQILGLDKRVFRADRSRLLKRLHREFPKCWTWITSNARVSGYSLVKRYLASSEVGPLVCELMNRESVEALLKRSIALTKKWPLEMSVPESNSTMMKTAGHLGFRLERKGLVMSYARLKPVVVDPAIGAFGFLDKG